MCATNAIIKDNKIFAGDFNGDRKTELLLKNNDATWKILYSTGKGYISSAFTFNQSVILNQSAEDHIIQVADFNGDGESNILHGYLVSGSLPSQSKFSLYYGKGYLPSVPFFFEQYTFNNALALGTYGTAQGIVVGDFNGDGRIGLLNRPNINVATDFISLKQLVKKNYW